MANVYIRDGGTGDGSAWDNALDDLPASLTRGNTYYIADGNYAQYNFDDAVSGTILITIKKATITDHGTETGWDNTYGDGQAVFTNWWIVSTDYWAIDGNKSIGSYGFKIVVDSGSSVPYAIRLWASGSVGCDNVTVEDVEIDMSAVSGNFNGPSIADNIDLTIRNIRILLCPGDAFSFDNATNVTIEYCHIDTRGDSQGVHADAIVFNGDADNITIRWNKIDWDGQQIFFGTNPSIVQHGTFYIYGNIFYGGPNSGKGIATQSSDPTIIHVYSYNNTFANLGTQSTSLGVNGDGTFKNNIFYDVGSAPDLGSTHDYNWFKIGMSTQSEANAQTGDDPFTNYIGEDFTLSSNTNSGTDLGAPYNTDRLENTRTTWSRGAFEFTGEDSSETLVLLGSTGTFLSFY